MNRAAYSGLLLSLFVLGPASFSFAENSVLTKGVLRDAKSGEPLAHTRLEIGEGEIAEGVIHRWPKIDVVTDEKGKFEFHRHEWLPMSDKDVPPIKVIPFSEKRWKIHRATHREIQEDWRKEDLLERMAVKPALKWTHQNGKPELTVEVSDLGELKVRVLGPEGKPWAKMGIEVYPVESTLEWGFRDTDTLRFTGMTDEEGEFRMRWRPGVRRFYVVAPGAGFGSTGSIEVIAGKTTSATMPPLARFAKIAGHADLETIGPNARVVVRTKAWNQTTAVFNRQGNFTLLNVTPGWHTLRVEGGPDIEPVTVFSMPGDRMEGIQFVPAAPKEPERPMAKPAAEPPTRRGRPQGVLTGRVTTLDGKPVPGAEILVSNPYHAGIRMGEKFMETRTDEKGEYRVEDIQLVAATVGVVAHKQGHPPAFAQGEPLGDEKTRRAVMISLRGYGPLPIEDGKPVELRANLVLAESGGRLKVRVLDVEGRPASSVAVRAAPSDWRDYFRPDQGVFAGPVELRRKFSRLVNPIRFTGEDGTAEFENLPPGRYDIIALNDPDAEKWLENDQPWRLRGIQSEMGETHGIPVAAGQTKQADVLIAPPLTPTTFRVFDPDGKPVKDRSVEVNWAPVGQEYGRSTGIRVDANGLMNFHFDKPGLWRITVKFRDSELKTIPIRTGPYYEAETFVAISNCIPDRAPIELHTTFQGGEQTALDVQLLDHKGRPAEGTVVIVATSPHDPPAHAATTDREGRVRFTNLTRWKHRVRGYVKGEEPLPWPELDMPDEQLSNRMTVPIEEADLTKRSTKITLRPKLVGYIRGQIVVPEGEEPTKYGLTHPSSYEPVSTSLKFDRSTGRFLYGPVLPGKVAIKLYRSGTPDNPEGFEAGVSELVVPPGRVAKMELKPLPKDQHKPYGAAWRYTPISGQVVRSDGQTPADAARIFQIVPVRPVAVAGDWCDAKGRFHTVSLRYYSQPDEDPNPEGSPEGPVLLALLPGEIGGTIVPVPEEPEYTQIVLPPPISLTGKVTIAGKPIAEYPGRVRIYAGYEGRGKLDQYLSIDTTANRDGSFALNGLTPGKYTVQAALDNIWLSKGLKLEVTADAKLKPLKLDIPEPGAGTIIELQNKQGSPLPNRAIRIEEPNGPLTRILRPPVYQTDGKGAVWLDGLRAGRHVISIPESGTKSEITVAPLSAKSVLQQRVVVEGANTGEN